MNSVFIVWHSCESEGAADEKLIGVYATREDAEAAIDRSSRKLGFQDSPEGFEVSEYVLGEDHWIDGYVSRVDALRDPNE